MTAKIEQVDNHGGQDSQDEETSIRQLEQVKEDRTARRGQPNRISRPIHLSIPLSIPLDREKWAVDRKTVGSKQWAVNSG